MYLEQELPIWAISKEQMLLKGIWSESLTLKT